MIKEIVVRCAALDVYEKRESHDAYFEVVFFNKDNGEWNNILTGILGPAVKPPKAKPSKEDSLLTKDYGGIYEGQTLFKKEFDGFIVIAVFWPWQDGTHTTLKIAVVKKHKK